MKPSKRWGCLAILSLAKDKPNVSFFNGVTTQEDIREARRLINNGDVVFDAISTRFKKWREANPGKTGRDFENEGLSGLEVIYL